MAAAGVDFGHTSLVIAACKDGRPEIVTTDTGEWVTPAIVAFTDKEQVMGTAAKLGLIRNASNTITNVKAVIGSLPDEKFHEIAKISPAKIIRKSSHIFYEINQNGKQILISPSDIINSMYKNILKSVQAYHGSDANQIVLTVPLHFGEKERGEMRSAAEKAGFRVLRIIHEPSAAALAYGVGQDDPSSNSLVLVYHLGGRTLQITLISVNSGIYRIIDSIYDDGIGGKKFDEVLVHHLATEFKRMWKDDIKENKRAMAKLRAGAETCKHVLTSHGTATCSVESLHDGIDFQCNVSRARFESLSSQLFQNCLNPIKELLEKCNIQAANIDKVILCGGSTRIPRLQSLLQDIFKGKELLKRISPEGVVAYGAAVQASLLHGDNVSEQHRNSHRINCTAKAIAVRVNKDTDSPLVTVIPSLTPIPVKRIHKFTSSHDDQSNICLDVFEIFENDLQKEHQLLAKVILDELPALPKEDCKISASFHVKIDGSLHIHVSEKSSGKSVGVIVEHG
ncbi:heat shock 70 kDa protein 14-like [Dendronephthya gigantea]|uniref:heat shock 70 kDa protein 14-like n=1 Tax=Dendronephthya gigantea TaxID=151771 RepID=UPI00106B21EB|nr:heat shock 70 kDa protein 14-like [Dendronephthya gigantea]